MKKVIEINIGRINFSMEDDAYFLLKSYFNRFEATITDKQDTKEVMEDVEMRVAEIFQKEMKFSNQVVDVELVKVAIACLGDIESETREYTEEKPIEPKTTNMGAKEKRFYRNPEDVKIAGVCSGVAAYFDVDVTIVRVLFLLALFLYGTALLFYIVLWIVIPSAKTVAQKLEMKGIPVTAENIKNYSTKYGI